MNSNEKDLNEVLNIAKEIREKTAKVKAELGKVKSDVRSLKEDIYRKNLRDSIKALIDDLICAFNISPDYASISWKIGEIKNKINTMIEGLEENEKNRPII